MMIKGQRARDVRGLTPVGDRQLRWGTLGIGIEPGAARACGMWCESRWLSTDRSWCGRWPVRCSDPDLGSVRSLVGYPTPPPSGIVAPIGN